MSEDSYPFESEQNSSYNELVEYLTQKVNSELPNDDCRLEMIEKVNDLYVLERVYKFAFNKGYFGILSVINNRMNNLKSINDV